MFRYALEHLNLLIPRYQLSSQIGEIRDEDARVEVALEEVVACVFEPGFGEVLEADALVDVVELFCLYTLGGQFVVNEGGREGRGRKKERTDVVLIDSKLRLELLPLLIRNLDELVDLVALEEGLGLGDERRGQERLDGVHGEDEHPRLWEHRVPCHFCQRYHYTSLP